jgi:hypothetical protein
LALAVLAPAPASADAPGVIAQPSDDLGRAVAALSPGETLRLGPGDYVLAPHPFGESTCGNCEDPATRVAASVGLLVGGRGLRIVGSGPDSTRIHTRAGYGILFQGCVDCALEAVTVTGGARDADGNATDAAIVVKHSRVTIRNCRISDNIGDAPTVRAVVVGIMGIAGREGSEIHIEGNRIIRNSWDGIALYRGASATIVGNVIDGVDAARGETIGGGRGVGIGVTWDARVVARGNLVRRYWKGIGLFVDAQGILEENVVEDVLTWGISLWDAGKGRPSGQIRRNAVFRTGACGVSVTRESADPPDPGELRGNAIVATGQDPRYDSGEPYCFQTAIARHAVPDRFVIAENLLHDNREPSEAPGSGDIPRSEFEAAAASLLERLVAWRSLWGSAFLVEYGR